MEFSFDRSNEARQQQRNTTQSEPARAGVQTPPQATQASTEQNNSHEDGIDTSTIANERLRKAIERNRARQADRNRNQPPQAVPAQQEQATLFDKPQAQAPAASEEESTIRVPPHRPRAQERAQASNPVKSSEVVTRRSAARPDEADFTPVKRAPRKVSSQISYTTASSRKKSKSLDPKLAGYLVKGCWIFCAVMVLRLFFANGGVTDYYSNRSVYNDRLSELDRIKKENMQLVREIERMQTDVAFQRKLVRDNLGFIASDEFLVLFPKEKSVQ